jgi:hypothetical protein
LAGVINILAGIIKLGSWQRPTLLILSGRTIRRWEEEEQNISGPAWNCGAIGLQWFGRFQEEKIVRPEQHERRSERGKGANRFWSRS